jgi:hypothetical protein
MFKTIRRRVQHKVFQALCDETRGVIHVILRQGTGPKATQVQRIQQHTIPFFRYSSHGVSFRLIGAARMPQISRNSRFHKFEIQLQTPPVSFPCSPGPLYSEELGPHQNVTFHRSCNGGTPFLQANRHRYSNLRGPFFWRACISLHGSHAQPANFRRKRGCPVKIEPSLRHEPRKWVETGGLHGKNEVKQTGSAIARA